MINKAIKPSAFKWKSELSTTTNTQESPSCLRCVISVENKLELSYNLC